MSFPVFFVYFNQSNKKITTAEGELQIGIGHLGRELENWHGHLTGNNFIYIYIFTRYYTAKLRVLIFQRDI